MSFLKIDGKEQPRPHCEKCDKDIEGEEKFNVQVGSDRVAHYQHVECPVRELPRV